jgi:hypothetical protein
MLDSHVKHWLLLSLGSLLFGVAGCSGEAGSGAESEGAPAEVAATAKQALAPGSDAAFVWSSSLTGSITASSAYSYNSSGGTNQITQIGTGQYRVDFPGVGSIVGGDVQVTAYGSGSERCKVASWGSSGSTLQVYVNCFTTTGVATNSLFTANYVRRSDHPGIEGGYVWAHNQSSASYTPGSTYSWNSTGGAISITHTPGSNSYAVSLGGQNLSGGTVEVTAYGSSNSYCKVAGWGGSSINVVCFTGSGAPTESQFDLIFSTKSPSPFDYRANSPNNTWSFSYAWAYSPSAASYTLSGSYQLGVVSCCTDGAGYPFGPAQAPGTITRSSAGSYTVKFPGMATLSTGPSNVKVTGYGSGSDTCKVVGWYTSGNDAFANVACFNSAGVRVDALYTITYSSFAYTIG